MSAARLDFDYVARSRRATWLGYALLAASIVVASEVALRYRDVQDERARMAELDEPLQNMQRLIMLKDEELL